MLTKIVNEKWEVSMWMNVLKFVVFIVLLVLVQIVWACENPRVEYGLYTHHVISDRHEVNEVNEMLGIQCGGWQLATFQNSYKGTEVGYDATTYAVGYSLEFGRNINVGAGVFTGYKDKAAQMPEFIHTGLGDLIWYIAPQVVVWGDQVGIKSLSGIGVGARLHGEVFSMSLVSKW
jgi:hypothetical protein